jgi:hypothetical protein
MKSGYSSQFSFACACLLLAVSSQAQVNVLTHRNDPGRTGQNTNETTLTLANVNTNTFGKLFSYPVDGHIYAQPLYVSGVLIPGLGARNVVYVATQHNGVYAFDADSNTGPDSGVLWQTNLGTSAVMPNSDFGNRYGPYHDINPEVGITGTPVIDLATGTMYLDAFTHEGSSYYHRIHTFNITNGMETLSPVVVGASVPGTGAGSSGGVLPFVATLSLQRAAMTLVGGTLYVTFTGYADTNPYHGWIFGYNKTNLQLLPGYIFNSTPNSTTTAYGANAGEGGIWMAGNGLCVDSANNLFFMTGNGIFNATNSGGTEYGDCFMRLSTTNGLAVADWFSPFNQSTLAAGDTDLGSGGCILLPDAIGTPAHPHLMLGAGKEGKIYLIDRESLGKFNPGSDTNLQSVASQIRNSFSTPAYFNNQIYYQCIGDNLKAFGVTNGVLASAPASQSATTIGFPGASPSISANGNNNGIVWVLQNDASGSGGPAILHAYDAANVGIELYNSSQAGIRDRAAPAVKTTIPTIANGKVYAGGQYALTVFGTGAFVGVPVIAPNGGLFTNSLTVSISEGTPGATLYYTLDNSTPTTSSPVYSGPLVVTNTTAIRVIAMKPGYVPSPLVAATFINSAAYLFSPRFLKQEFYSGATRANLEDPSFTTSPTFVRYVTSFETPGGQGNNYAERVSGYFVPTQSANYVFFLASDDDSDLFLSPDATSANKKLIASETVWSNSREYLSSGGGSVLASKRSDQFAGTAWPSGNTISLLAGNQYYIEAVHHQGGGGDDLAVIYKLAGAADPANGTAPNLIGTNIGTYAYDNTFITITRPLEDAVAVEGSSAAFSVGASSGYLGDTSGATPPPLVYQWQSAPNSSGSFVDLPGANASTYVTPALTLTDNGSEFRSAIITAGALTNSSPGLLTVVHDATPPVPVQIVSVSTSARAVTVAFSEPLDPASAQNAANYLFAPGNLNPTNAILDSTGTNVTISTATALPQNTMLTLAIGNVRDLHGNPVPAGTSISFSFTVLSSGAGFAPAALADAPLGYWRLNESSGTTAVDAVGAHNGSYGSAAILGGAGPRPPTFGGFENTNRAVQTQGATANSYVTVPFGSLSTNTVTFVAWVYPLGPQDGRAGILVSRGNGASGGMGYNGQTLSYTWNNNNANTYNFPSGLTIPSNQWSMVAMVIYPEKAILYLANPNGLFSATNAIAHSSDVFGNNWQIGHDNNSGNSTRTFNGYIDEVAVFTKSLAPDRIAAYYQAASQAGVSITNGPVNGGGLRFTAINVLDGEVVLQWLGTAILEEAPDVNGPWIASANQNNPSVAPASGTRFFRLRGN